MRLRLIDQVHKAGRPLHICPHRDHRSIAGGSHHLTKPVSNRVDDFRVQFDVSITHRRHPFPRRLICPGGTVVFVGMPMNPIAYDVSTAAVKEPRIEHVFRYAHVYPRVVALMGSGKLDVKPLITDKFAFADSVEAFDFAVEMPPTSVKAQIELRG